MTKISPCNKVCRLEQGVCVGCFRTASEISMWSVISDETAQAVISSLPERQRRLKSHLEEIVE